MKIGFKDLSDTDFSLLFSWLQAPHVKKWWDQEVNYTLDLVKEKYSSYVKGYKKVDGENKPIHAFIIHSDEHPIGYIQYYNAYDFPRDDYKLVTLPKSLAAIDLFVGDKNYLGKGIGQKVLELFLENYVFTEFDYVIVDPESNNLVAISTYKKVGFRTYDDQIDPSMQLMIKPKKVFDEIELLEKKLLASPTKKSIKALDELLATDFKEFGKSGFIYDKQEILNSLLDEEPRNLTAKYFEVKLLENKVYLVTYTTIENGISTLRSSIWKSFDNRLQMLFHQGTEVRCIQ